MFQHNRCGLFIWGARRKCLLCLWFRAGWKAVKSYTSVVQGNDGIASAVATILLAVTRVSLLLFMKFSKNKDIAF